jgi:uncharacterized protein YbjT (DUF2867 family)
LILLLIFNISLPARGLLQYRLKMAPTFLVTGATGTQGGPTAHILLSQKVTVHAFVRNISSAASQALQKAGAILFQGDFDDTTSIKAAMTGVSSIFLNPSPTAEPGLQVRQAQNFIDAAVACNTVKTIVYPLRSLLDPEILSGATQNCNSVCRPTISRRLQLRTR